MDKRAGPGTIALILGALVLGACASGSDGEVAGSPPVVRTQMTATNDDVKALTDAVIALAATVDQIQGDLDDLDQKIGPYASTVEPLSDQIDELDARLGDTEECVDQIRMWTTTMRGSFYC